MLGVIKNEKNRSSILKYSYALYQLPSRLSLISQREASVLIDADIFPIGKLR